MKNLKLFALVFLMLFIVTGCTSKYNSSPEAVAEEMVKRLSKDEYGNMKDIFYHDEDSYFDEKVFQKLVETKKLNIKDNKKVEISEVGSEITGKDGNVHVKVKIEIDDGNIFNIDAVNVNNKWYVYDEDFYDGAMTFIVPEGSKVYLNGKQLDSSYAGKQKTMITLVHPSNRYREITENNYLNYGYKVNKVLKGQYDITIENDKTIKDVVYSSKNSSIKSTNYTYQTFSDSADGIIYFFGEAPKCESTKEQKESIKKYFDGFYKDLAEALNKHTTFPTMEKYFEKDSDSYKETRSSYDKSGYYVYTKSNPYKSSYYSYWYSGFKFEKVEIKEVYYCSDESILVALAPSIAYDYHAKYTSSSSNYTSHISSLPLVKLKKTNDSYIMIEKYNLFW